MHCMSTTPNAHTDSQAANGRRSRHARRMPGHANSIVTASAVASDQGMRQPGWIQWCPRPDDWLLQPRAIDTR